MVLILEGLQALGADRLQAMSLQRNKGGVGRDIKHFFDGADPHSRGKVNIPRPVNRAHTTVADGLFYFVAPFKQLAAGHSITGAQAIAEGFQGSGFILTLVAAFLVPVCAAAALALLGAGAAVVIRRRG